MKDGAYPSRRPNTRLVTTAILFTVLSGLVAVWYAGNVLPNVSTADRRFAWNTLTRRAATTMKRSAFAIVARAIGIILRCKKKSLRKGKRDNDS